MKECEIWVQCSHGFRLLADDGELMCIYTCLSGEQICRAKIIFMLPSFPHRIAVHKQQVIRIQVVSDAVADCRISQYIL